jgi:antitoxin (DNA-binding transcriptional repressor) of toxin-antitoxin stability system
LTSASGSVDGDAVDRVAAGGHVTVTRSGKPVAELRPIRRPPLKATVLPERWRISDTSVLPGEPVISTVTLAELSVRPL